MKTVVGPFAVIPAYSILSATLTGSVTDVRRVDNVVYQLQASPTGSGLTGTLIVQGSVDYQYSMVSAIQPTIGSGTWITVSTSSVTSPTGALNVITLNQSPYPFLRAIFSATAGTSTGSVWVYGKALGA